LSLICIRICASRNGGIYAPEFVAIDVVVVVGIDSSTTTGGGGAADLPLLCCDDEEEDDEEEEEDDDDEEEDSSWRDLRFERSRRSLISKSQKQILLFVFNKKKRIFDLFFFF
jgi:hypothetical protein